MIDIIERGIIMIWQNSNRKTGNSKKLDELKRENEALKDQMQSVMATVEALSKAADSSKKK